MDMIIATNQAGIFRMVKGSKPSTPPVKTPQNSQVGIAVYTLPKKKIGGK